MNSFINREGKRKWARSEEVEDILGTFSLLTGYTPEIDTLIVESLREIGFELVERGLLHFQEEPLIYVMKREDGWFAGVGGAEEPVLTPRALWGDIRMAWNRHARGTGG